MNVPIEAIRKVSELAWHFCDLDDGLPSPHIAEVQAWLESGPVVEILQAGGIIHCRQGGELFLHPDNEVEWKADGIGIAGFQLPQHVYFCSTYRTLPAEPQADLPVQEEKGEGDE